jgi:hypothetical protein
MVMKYLQAEQAILECKQISFQGRAIGMEDLGKVIAGREEWEQRVSAPLRASDRFGSRLCKNAEKISA